MACSPDRDPADYLPDLAACLREAGWDAQMNEDGDGMSFDFGSPDRRQAFEADKAACEQRIGTPPPEPLTDAQIRAQYQHLIDMRRCLLRLGYPTSTPPPEDAFVETWRATEFRPGEGGRVVQDAPWSPFLDLPGPALADVEEQCPQSPSSD